MKKNKVLTTILLSLLASVCFGQSTYIDKFSLRMPDIIIGRYFMCDIASGDVIVTGGKGDSIKIEAEVYNAPGKNYTCSDEGCMIVDESFFRFSVKPREGETIKTIKVVLPYKLAVSIDLIGCGSISISNMDGEIQIKSRRLGNIELNNVKGPLSISGTYGDVKVNFAQVLSKKLMAISLVKGNIFINIPKGNGITIASSCPDERSLLKDYPVKSIVTFKNRKDTTNCNATKLENRKISIGMDYKERIETREAFGFVNKKTRKIGLKSISMKEDVWVYDINGGGANIEVKIWQGEIQINEVN